MKRPKTFASNTPPDSGTRSTNSNESSERLRRRANDRMGAIGIRPWARFVVILAVAAGFGPLRIFTVNAEKFPHPERVLLLVAGLMLLGVVWYVGFRLLRFDPDSSLAAAFTFVLLFGLGGPLAARITTVAALAVVVGGSIVMALLSTRLGNRFARSVVTFGAVFFALSVGATGLLDTLGEQGESRVQAIASSIPASIASQPDIYLIVLDGFPGEVALREIYESDIDLPAIPGVDRIEAWASYPMTVASVASIVQMGYPLSDGDIIDEANASDLAEIMAGENRFAELLAEEGYHATHVESGYSRSFCAAVVDTCVESAFLDEGIFRILDQTVLRRELRTRKGSSFTENGLHVMAWLEDNLPRLAENNRPDYVFANVQLPHPPMLLDENCVFTYAYWRDGNAVFAGEEVVDARQQAFVDQTQCIAKLESDLFGLVPEDAVVIAFSDHGGDSLGQMSHAGHAWSMDDVIERLNAHLALRSPIGCPFDPPVLLSELLRDLLWCLAGEDPPTSPAQPLIHSASRIDGTLDYELSWLSQDEMAQLGLP